MTARVCGTCRRPFEASGKARYCSDECRHGTDAGYAAGCTCDRCRRAHSRHHKQLRCFPNPMVPAAGTHRRVQALARLGWSSAELSRRLGRHRSYLRKVLYNTTLDPATVASVAALYDELCMTWCTSPTAGRVAADARRRGWAPPLAWDDHTIDDPAASPHGGSKADAGVDMVAVSRVLAGEWRLPTTRDEKVEVVRQWRATGRPVNELARLTGWKPERYYDAVEEVAS